MVYRLPPLKTLRLFEAAGRHASFRKAAEELALTPSAVSHGIRTLEDWLGASLFARGPGTLALTAAGRAYLPRIREALETIARASDGVPGRRPNGRLTVSAAPTFGMRWLAPNLQHFAAAHPGIDIALDTAQRAVEFPRDGVDVAIRLGRGDWPELTATLLFNEWLVPVCAPSLAAGIATAGDLARLPAIHVVTARDDWESWRALAGAPEGAAGARAMRVDNIALAMEAAAAGSGVAIGRLPLIRAEIDAGRVVPVLGPPRRAPSGYWLVCARESLARPEVKAFRSWIKAAVKPLRAPQA
jgi:LysR family transcriptional regulator, glycine cleavage system transcriptional activator